MKKLKDLFQVIETFLEELERKENLSPWARREKIKVIDVLKDFRNENQSLFVEENQSNSIEQENPDELYDENFMLVSDHGGPTDIPLEDDLYDETDMAIPTSPPKTDSTSEIKAEEDLESAPKPIAAKDIENPQMTGILEQKKKSDKFAMASKLLGGFKKRYVVLKDDTLYMYKKETDKAQKDTICIEGYDIRPVPGLNKDKMEKSFQLFCPAKATYEFLASSKEDCKKWSRALEGILGKNTLGSASSSEGVDDLDGEELYDEADNITQKNVVKPIEESEELYDDTAGPNDTSLEPDWALPPPPEEFLVPSRPAKTAMRNYPKPPPPEPEETYDDTCPPEPIADDIYDDAMVEDGEMYDDTTVSAPPPLPHPKLKLPGLPALPIPPRQPALPPPPVEEEIYDDAEVPPPRPAAKVPIAQPPVPMQPRPQVPLPPEEESGEEYDDVETMTVSKKSNAKPPIPPIKATSQTKEYPGIEDFDNMYLSKWDHEPTQTDELSMKRGDMISILDKLYRDWWVGCNGNTNKIGLVPPVFLMKAYDLYIE